MTVAAPGFVSPMLVSRGPLPTGPSWAYEVKWDGIRGQVALREGAVTVRSRPGRDCSECFPELADPPPALGLAGARVSAQALIASSGDHVERGVEALSELLERARARPALAALEEWIETLPSR